MLMEAAAHSPASDDGAPGGRAACEKVHELPGYCYIDAAARHD